MSRHAGIVEQAQDLMRDDPAAGWTIPQLAAACNTSPSVLKTAFRAEAGMPVYAWYRSCRMERACQLMRENPMLPIARIAAEVGYANPSKFSHAFRICLGQTPTEWRESQSRPLPGPERRP